MRCGKICFATRGEAKARVRENSKIGNSTSKHVYGCPDCGYWHMTSQTKRINRVKKRQARERMRAI